MEVILVMEIIWWQMLQRGEDSDKQIPLKSHKNITVVLNGIYGLLHLPADSPVLIQSGFAMLAIAKISAARNRHPEMIVSLSISPANEALNDVEKNVVVVQMWPRVLRDTGWAVISLTSPPSTGACCCGSAVHFAATLAPSCQTSESPQQQKARVRHTKASHLKCPL